MEQEQFTQKQLEDGSKVINDTFQKFGIDARVTAADFLSTPISGFLSLADPWDNPFVRLLEAKAENRKSSHRLYYHYRNPEILRSILTNGYLQVSHLSAQKDDQEFIHFYKETGIWDEVSGYSRLPKDEEGADIPCLSPIVIRDGVFALCMTETAKNPRFMDDYAAGGTGACLILEVIDTADNPAELPYYHLRHTYYVEAGEYEIFKTMQQRIIEAVGAPLNFAAVPSLAAISKRLEIYKWEDEARLFVDTTYLNLSYHVSSDNHFGCVQLAADGRKYLNVAIKRMPFPHEDQFRLRLRGILWGPKMEPSQKKDLNALVTANYDEVFQVDTVEDLDVHARSFTYGREDPAVSNEMELLLGLRSKRNRAPKKMAK